jgi:hypothetical protein
MAWPDLLASQRKKIENFWLFFGPQKKVSIVLDTHVQREQHHSAVSPI